jgi:hypothetical protein
LKPFNDNFCWAKLLLPLKWKYSQLNTNTWLTNLLTLLNLAALQIHKLTKKVNVDEISWKEMISSRIDTYGVWNWFQQNTIKNNYRDEDNWFMEI